MLYFYMQYGLILRELLSATWGMVRWVSLTCTRIIDSIKFDNQEGAGIPVPFPGAWELGPASWRGQTSVLTSHFSSPGLRVSEDLSVLARLPFTSCAPGTGGPFSGLTLSDFLPFSIPERQPSMSSAVPSCSVEGNRRVTHALRGLMPATAIEAE